MKKIDAHSRFKKDYKAIKADSKVIKELEVVIEYLMNDQKLPIKYRDHALKKSKKYKNFRECHVLPDLLLIYKKEEDVLSLLRIGSHSKLL